MRDPVDLVDPAELVDPERYGRRGYPHDTWSTLRAAAPVAWIEADGYEPFWAVTRHADIMTVASQPSRFSSAQGITLARAGAPPFPPTEILVLLDPPRHAPMRRIASPRLTPRAVRARRDEVDSIARAIVDEASRVSAGDFVEELAAPFPLAIIAWLLGVPNDDWQLLFRWTNEIIGKDDPDFRRAGETPGQTIKRARHELRSYFATLIEQRRQCPQPDLMSDLLAATFEGQPLTDDQLLSYCELFVEAGNETTRNAISGGLLAFAEHPEEWHKLRENPDLLATAVDEILRWVSPISHFTRVATEDCELGGQAIRAGDQLALYFASANRDDAVFDEPFAFRVDRAPNHHLAFGFGEHFCLGAHLARQEIELIFGHLLVRLESFDVAGNVLRLNSAVNGSIKHLPMQYQWRPAASDRVDVDNNEE